MKSLLKYAIFLCSVVGFAQTTNTMQQTCKNSGTTQPKLTTTTTNGAIKIQCGSAANTDTVFAIKNIAGSTTFGVLANGSINSKNNLLKYNSIDTSLTVTNSFNTAGIKMKISSTGIINVTNAPTYADDTAAGVGGLVTGDVYQQTTTHFLMIKQ